VGLCWNRISGQCFVSFISLKCDELLMLFYDKSFTTDVQQVS
jgi:hypothetical protein